MKSIAILFCLVFALSKAAAQDVIAPTNHIEFFKVITDAQTGEYAVVNSAKTVVTMKDKNGNVIWTADIVKEYGAGPVQGEKKIHSMELINNLLAVDFAGGLVILDKKTGKITGDFMN
jgi:hypothetical protein